jgi:hypothetical protein
MLRILGQILDTCRLDWSGMSLPGIETAVRSESSRASMTENCATSALTAPPSIATARRRSGGSGNDGWHG